MRSTALLLGLCQLLFMSAAAVGISFNALIGAKLAISPSLATLPFLFITASTALLTLALPNLFAQFGYRMGFCIGALLGVLGGVFCAWAVWVHSFWLFCFACFLLGGYQASALYYRFAAADAVPPDQKSAALGWVLSGGIIAALVGPWLGSQGLHLFTVDYFGSYLLTAVLALLAVPVLWVTRLPPRQAPQTTEPLILAQLLRHPSLLPAVLFCAGSYGLMMFVMLATPLAIHHQGHTTQAAASVIQWHLLGMFAPSLITGKAIGRYGAQSIALLGCAVLGTGCIVALSGSTLSLFHVALLLVGIGWNLMYMGGSTMLAQVRDEHIRARLQALNEFSTFAVMALTAGITGWFYQHLGWHNLLGSTLGLLMAVTVMALLSERKWLRGSELRS